MASVRPSPRSPRRRERAGLTASGRRCRAAVDRLRRAQPSRRDPSPCGAAARPRPRAPAAVARGDGRAPPLMSSAASLWSASSAAASMACMASCDARLVLVVLATISTRQQRTREAAAGGAPPPSPLLDGSRARPGRGRAAHRDRSRHRAPRAPPAWAARCRAARPRTCTLRAGRAGVGKRTRCRGPTARRRRTHPCTGLIRRRAAPCICEDAAAQCGVVGELRGQGARKPILVGDKLARPGLKKGVPARRSGLDPEELRRQVPLSWLAARLT